QIGMNAPVVFLTARDDTSDKITGLTVGGDDYVTKPFSLEEAVARIRAVLRRTRSLEDEENAVIVAGDLELDDDTHEVPAPASSSTSPPPNSSCCATSCSTRTACCRSRRSSTTCGSTTSAATPASSSPISPICVARSTSLRKPTPPATRSRWNGLR